MQKVAFITGTSRGIGQALAELLLKENYLVYGYSRTNYIKHPNFTFIKVDLSNLEEVKNISFPKLKNTNFLLVNNAARVGSIIPLNMKKEVDIVHDYNLNIIAPTILCAKFINYNDSNKKMIINISSGAANNNIASWSTYCASKSALDRLTNVIFEEKHRNLTIFSVYPAVVDTKMQAEIRNTDINLFPLKSKFTDLFKKNQLESTENVAQKLFYIIQNHTKYYQNILSIREIDIN